MCGTIARSSDISTSYHEDFTWIGCESTWTWFYGTTMNFLLGIYADSYESAIRGFWDDEITLTLGVI